MTAAPRIGCRATLRLLALVLCLVGGHGQVARAADAALTGNWYTETEVETSGGKSEKHGIVWKISGAGALTICEASVEKGFLFTDPETWAVRRPDHSGDVAHGKYQIVGADSLSTRIAGLPADDIVWKRLARDGKPARVPGCLLKLIQPAVAANGERPAFNAALAGLWEASYPLNGLRRETVWRITPDGQSLRLDVQMKPMTFTAGGGRMSLKEPADTATLDLTYRLADKDTLEIMLGNESMRFSRCAD